MIQINPLSQHDSRWSNQLLGNSNVTIGGYGCVITCLTMLAGKLNVGETNDLFKQKKVYLDPNLVIWGKVPDVYPNLQFVNRYNYYDNNIVSDYVYNKKTPVIVQVDAGPIGSPRTDHYVIYLGDKKLVDPWTGTIRPTSDFPIQRGFITYEIKPLVPILTCDQKIGQIKDLVNSNKPDSDVRYLIKQII